MKRLKTKHLNKSIALAIAAVLLLSCKEGETRIAVISPETTPTLTSINLQSIESENGMRKYRLETPLLEEFDEAAAPYREFKKGLKVETYFKDSTTIESTLVADYARYDKTKKIWEARGHVIARNILEDKTLYTDQLFWDETKKIIYSEKPVKIIDRGDIFHGSGFEADEQFTKWRFNRSRFSVEVKNLTDSTQSTTTTAPVAPQSTDPQNTTTRTKPLNTAERAAAAKKAAAQKSTTSPPTGAKQMNGQSPGARPFTPTTSKPGTPNTPASKAAQTYKNTPQK